MSMYSYEPENLRWESREDYLEEHDEVLYEPTPDDFPTLEELTGSKPATATNPFALPQNRTHETQLPKIEAPARTKKTKKASINYDAEVIKKAMAYPFYIDPRKNLWVGMPDKNGIEQLFQLDSESFSDCMYAFLYEKYGNLPHGFGQLKGAVKVVKHQATQVATPREFINRVGIHDEVLYLNRCTQTPSFIRMELNTGEISIVQTSPFIPRLFPHQEPLPVPEKPGDHPFDALFTMLGVTDVLDKLALYTYLTGRLFPDILKPYLLIEGCAGSGKTTLAYILKSIIDPTKYGNYMPTNRNDLVQLLDHQEIPVLDNLTSLSLDTSNFLSSAYSGCASSKKKLYTDGEDYTQVIRNSCIITTTGIKKVQDDFLSRVLILKRPSLTGKYISETDISDMFKFIHAGLLYELLVLVHNIYFEVRNTEIPVTRDRSVKFSAIGRTIARVYCGDESVYDMLEERNNLYRTKTRLDSNVAGSVLIEFMRDNKTFQGNSSAIIKALQDCGLSLPDYLCKPRTFSDELARSEHLLAEHGITFTKGSVGHQHSVYTITNQNFGVDEPENDDAQSLDDEEPLKL